MHRNIVTVPPNTHIGISGHYRGTFSLFWNDKNIFIPTFRFGFFVSWTSDQLFSTLRTIRNQKRKLVASGVVFSWAHSSSNSFFLQFHHALGDAVVHSLEDGQTRASNDRSVSIWSKLTFWTQCFVMKGLDQEAAVIHWIELNLGGTALLTWW